MKKIVTLALMSMCCTYSAFASSASVDCIKYIYADAGYNKAKAARACSGGASVDCIKFVYADAGYNKAKAARACSGR